MKENRIVIEITDKTASKMKETPNASEVNTPLKESEEMAPVQGVDNTGYAMAGYALSSASNMISQFADYSYGKYTQLTENYVAQNAVRQTTAVVNAAVSIISSAATGAAIGGPWGAVAGAIIGVANVGVTTAKTYLDSYQELDRKAYDKYYQGERYGLINGNRGTEN